MVPRVAVLSTVATFATAMPGAQAQPPPAGLAGEALSGGGAYDFARELADGVGNRPAGSAAAERATAWAEATLRRLGAKDVRRERALVPLWTRGEESAEIL